MEPQARPRQRWTARHPVLLDVAFVALALVVELFLSPRLGDEPRPSPALAVLTVLALGLVPLRHRWPVPTLVATVAVTSVVVAVRGHENVALLAPLAVLYLVALRASRGTAVLAWAATLAVLAGAEVAGHPGSSLLLRTLPLLPWTVVPVVLGDGVRSRRAYLAAVEERAERAISTREEEARRRVAEERVRIARELHDVVAHHTAVVTVQAGVAQHLLLTRPEAAAEALGQVRRAAGAVLAELGDILSVLREPDGTLSSGAAGGGDGPAGVSGARAPTPGLDRLDALVGSFAAAGLEVRWSFSGQPRPLATAVDLVAYRLVEESLTNALKHGTGEVRLTVEHAASSLRLRVDNAAPTLVPAGAGAHGAAHPGSHLGSPWSPGRARATGWWACASAPPPSGAPCPRARPAVGSSSRRSCRCARWPSGDHPGGAGRRPGADPLRLRRAGRLRRGPRGRRPSARSSRWWPAG